MDKATDVSFLSEKIADLEKHMLAADAVMLEMKRYINAMEEASA